MRKIIRRLSKNKLFSWKVHFSEDLAGSQFPTDKGRGIKISKFCDPERVSLQKIFWQETIPQCKSLDLISRYLKNANVTPTQAFEGQTAT